MKNTTTVTKKRDMRYAKYEIGQSGPGKMDVSRCSAYQSNIFFFFFKVILYHIYEKNMGAFKFEAIESNATNATSILTEHMFS